MQESIKPLLEQARNEILSLRRQNEVLRAKVDTMELFACVLRTQPAASLQGYGEDIARKLEREIQSIDAEKSNANNGTT
jgi:cob(I)alamin adenosyltransferase